MKRALCVRGGGCSDWYCDVIKPVTFVFNGAYLKFRASVQGVGERGGWSGSRVGPVGSEVESGPPPPHTTVLQGDLFIQDED